MATQYGASMTLRGSVTELIPPCIALVGQPKAAARRGAS